MEGETTQDRIDRLDNQLKTNAIIETLAGPIGNMQKMLGEIRGTQVENVKMVGRLDKRTEGHTEAIGTIRGKVEGIESKLEEYHARVVKVEAEFHQHKGGDGCRFDTAKKKWRAAIVLAFFLISCPPIAKLVEWVRSAL